MAQGWEEAIVGLAESIRVNLALTDDPRAIEHEDLRRACEKTIVIYKARIEEILAAASV